jgi:hypothetical protein
VPGAEAAPSDHAISPPPSCLLESSSDSKMFGRRLAARPPHRTGPGPVRPSASLRVSRPDAELLLELEVREAPHRLGVIAVSGVCSRNFR